MDELIVEFKSESEELVEELITILEEAEESFSHKKMLDQYGQIVDRIMGSATSLCMAIDEPEHMEQIGRYAEICKIVGYRGSQIESNEQFYTIVVAMLLDATETLQQLVAELGTKGERDLKDLLTNTFLERLKFVNAHFDENLRSSVASTSSGEKAKPGQQDIDDLLAALGL